jgi:thiopurine S-methyltransferase
MVLAGLHGGVITRQSWRGEAEQRLGFRREENWMQASFWIERWKKAEIGFHKSDIDTILKRFWSGLSLQPGQQVFVPLCGKSLDMLWLADQGHKVIGVELSPLACEAFFAENNLTPRLFREGAFEVWSTDEIRILQGDFFDLRRENLAGCAGVYDRASLVALPPQMRARYVRHLTAILPDAAEILLLTMEFDQAQRPGPPFAVSEAEVRTLYEPAYKVKHLHTQDSFSPHSHLARQGLTSLEEKLYRIVRP